MADRSEVNSQTGSELGACASDDSTIALPELDSADIIPEAAMKCGILPLDGDSMVDLSDGASMIAVHSSSRLT